MSGIHIAIILLEVLLAVGLLIWHGRERLLWYMAPCAILLMCDWILLYCKCMAPNLFDGYLIGVFALLCFLVGGIWMRGLRIDAKKKSSPNASCRR